MSSQDARASAAVRRTPPWRRYRRRATVIAALVLPLVVAAALTAVRGSYATPAGALTMIVVVAAVAVAGPRSAGVLASASSALWFDFFLTRPYLRFTISHRPDLETTVAIFVVGILITELAARSRHHFGAARDAYRFVTTIRDVAETAASGAPATVVVDRACAALTELLHLKGCRFDPQLEDPPLARVEPTGEVIHVGLVWPADDIGLPGPASEIVARGRGRVVGRFVLTPKAARPVSRERRIAAVSVVDLAAAALAGDGRGPEPTGP
ncbi:MAG: DUF4118 domain-containing protein [Acidimicrobiales bacterium]